MNKVVFIGIDAATWKIINPLCKEGKLPTFSKLIKTGVTASLKSIAGHKSPALWTSIATGKVPEKHGIIYFSNLFLDIPKLNVKKDITNSFLIDWPYRFGKMFSKDLRNPSKLTCYTKKIYIYSLLKHGKLLDKLHLGKSVLTTSNFRKEKTVWEMLSDENISCGVVGWLATWPAPPLKGWLVSQKAVEGLNKLVDKPNEETSQHSITFPESFHNELLPFKRSPSSISQEEMSFFFNSLSEEEKKVVQRDSFKKSERLSLFSYMYLSDIFSSEVAKRVKEKNPQFLSVYLPGLDGMQHVFWQYSFPEEFPFLSIDPEEQEKFGKTIENYYIFLDNKIGELISENENVIIVSDHGTNSISKEHYIPGSIRSGEHENSPDGILIMSGPDIQNGKKVTAHITDVAPTILYLLNKPLDSEMKGKVLSEALTDEFKEKVTERKKKYDKPKITIKNLYSKEEEDKVKERLEALGYLD